MRKLSQEFREGQGTENKERALLIFLRVHFWFPKVLLNLKEYDILNMKTNIVKRYPFSHFLLKGKKGSIFWKRDNKSAIHSVKVQAGHSALLILSGGNSNQFKFVEFLKKYFTNYPKISGL